MSDADPLHQLRQVARTIRGLERELASYRSIRDEEIKRVVHTSGLSERKAAGAAGVSPGYAHRACVHGRFARTVSA